MNDANKPAGLLPITGNCPLTAATKSRLSPDPVQTQSKKVQT